MESVHIESRREASGVVIEVYDTDTGEAAIITDVQFMKIVTQGTRYWVNAPAEVKRFSDIVNHGRPLQDYATFPAYNKPSNDRSKQS